MRKKWSEEEIKKLKDYIKKDFTNKDIAKRLERTEGSVYSKLNSLKITRPKSDYIYSIGDVINGVEIKERIVLGKENRKGYLVQSITYRDTEPYTMYEKSLKNGAGDSYISNQRVHVSNSLWSESNLRPYIINVPEAKKLGKYSKKTIKTICPDCKVTQDYVVGNLARRGFTCKICTRNISYPELFMTAYLEVKGIKYEYQKVFKDLPSRRFDFYLPESNTVIETHGIQHYDSSSSWYTDSLNQDKEKRIFCKNKNYTLIEVDCRISNFKFIEGQINSIHLLEPISKEEELGIQNLIENNKKYPIQDIISMYNKRYRIKDISRKYNMCDKTISNILNSSGISIRKNGKRKVRCITTEEIFESVTEAESIYNIPRGNISKVCRGYRSTTGKYKGEYLEWEYVD
ncbi:hypothetical protein [Staphylococcus phage Stab22]|nr:hypothetical protein [Staphylococcus phage Stab22]